jgi:uncharacterized protein (DUF2126 family)
MPVRAPHEDRARLGSAAGDPPVQRRAVAAIEALGHQIDADLSGDVRLTMGGEPTFRLHRRPRRRRMEHRGPRPDQAGARSRSLSPLRENMRRTAAALRSGQVVSGRAAAALVAELLLAARRPADCGTIRRCMPTRAATTAPTKSTGRALPATLAEHLASTRSMFSPAYEDVYYYLWREHRLPANVDPFRLPPRRPARTRAPGQGLSPGPRCGGRLCAAAAARAAGGWQSGPWFLRGGRCYLVPGDSPVGYRLPLDSQPWVAKEDYPYMHAPDPTQAFPATAVRTPRSARSSPSAAAEPACRTGRGERRAFRRKSAGTCRRCPCARRR